MKESAHALVGGRTGTAVVSLVRVQVGLTAQCVRRERRGPDYHAQVRGGSRGCDLLSRLAVLVAHATSGGTRLHTGQRHHCGSSAPTRDGVRGLLHVERLCGTKSVATFSVNWSRF